MNNSQLTVHHFKFSHRSDHFDRSTCSNRSPSSLDSPDAQGSYASSSLCSPGSHHPSRHSQLATHNSPLDQLREKIRAVETENRRTDGIIIKHGCEALDRLLPDGGYSRGTLTQWLSSGGQGAEYLSLRVAQQACQSGGALVIVDPQKRFFPPAAAALGIDLNHLIVLQTSHEKDLLWGIDQALRCPAVGAVWGWLEVIDQRQFRRFQLSAEAGGSIGLFLQPYAAARQPSWAEVQWLVGLGVGLGTAQAPTEQPPVGQAFQRRAAPAKGGQSGQSFAPQAKGQSCQMNSDQAPGLRTVSLQLTRCRGTHTGKSICLTIDPVTGAVEPASRRMEMTAGLGSANPRKRI